MPLEPIQIMKSLSSLEGIISLQNCRWRSLKRDIEFPTSGMRPFGLDQPACTPLRFLASNFPEGDSSRKSGADQDLNSLDHLPTLQMISWVMETHLVSYDFRRILTLLYFNAFTCLLKLMMSSPPLSLDLRMLS